MFVCRSIVQFAYGEDGIDVMNVSYLREFGFLSRNAERFAQQLNLQQALQATGLRHWEEEARALTRSHLSPKSVVVPVVQLWSVSQMKETHGTVVWRRVIGIEPLLGERRGGGFKGSSLDGVHSCRVHLCCSWSSHRPCTVSCA